MSLELVVDVCFHKRHVPQYRDWLEAVEDEVDYQTLPLTSRKHVIIAGQVSFILSELNLREIPENNPDVQTCREHVDSNEHAYSWPLETSFNAVYVPQLSFQATDQATHHAEVE